MRFIGLLSCGVSLTAFAATLLFAAAAFTGVPVPVTFRNHGTWMMVAFAGLLPSCICGGVLGVIALRESSGAAIFGLVMAIIGCIGALADWYLIGLIGMAQHPI